MREAGRRGGRGGGRGGGREGRPPLENYSTIREKLPVLSLYPPLL